MQDIVNRDRCLNLSLVGSKEQPENDKQSNLAGTIISEKLDVDLLDFELQVVHRSTAPLMG